MNFFQIFGFGKNKAMRPQDFTSDEAKAAAAWLQTVNPLRGMTATRMQQLYDASRAGDTVHLQWLYQEIEKIDPTLLICQQRRTGALAALDWNIKTRNQRRTRGFDETLAQEQADCLELAFGDADQANFNDAVEHLARGFFRGFSHVLPRWSDDGLSIKGFDCLDQWNFVRDPLTGQWYWNPEAHAYTGYAECRPIPAGELVTFVAPYHIDYPAMTIYLRSAVGEQGWAKFVERFGIPPVILTMPQDIPSDQVAAWRESAEKVAEGGSGAVPAGTTVNFCDGARGINPFKDFIHNQRELVVLMSTGGLLTSLTESGSGTLAGGAHSDTWAEVRRMDSAKVGSVLNRTLADAILDRAFPGRPHLAYFAFDTEAVPSPGEVFDDAAKAKASGYLIDKADLEERTGYRLVKDETAAPALPGMFGNRKLENRESPSSARPLADESVLAAFAKDTGPAAKAIQELLKNPSMAAAKALLGKLDTLLPEDPEMAAVIAEAMAAEFGDDGRAGAPRRPLENVTDAKGNEHSDVNGKFVKKGSGGAGDEQSKTETKKKSKESTPDEFGYTKSQRDKIGQVGDWKTLNLPAMRDIPADPPIPLNKIEEARARIAAGETVTNPFGETLSIDNRFLSHIDRKGRNPKQLQDKLQYLDAAKETFEHPHEIWHDESNPKNLRTYVRITLDPTGRRVVNGVDDGIDHVLSWHTNDVSFDHYRKGRLLWIRK